MMHFASFACLVGSFVLVPVLASDLRVPQNSNTLSSIQRRALEIIEPTKERKVKASLSSTPNNAPWLRTWTQHPMFLSSKSMARKSSPDFKFKAGYSSPLTLLSEDKGINTGSKASRLIRGGAKNTFNAVKVPLSYVGGGARNTMNAAKIPLNYVRGGARNTLNAAKMPFKYLSGGPKNTANTVGRLRGSGGSCT